MEAIDCLGGLWSNLVLEAAAADYLAIDDHVEHSPAGRIPRGGARVRPKPELGEQTRPSDRDLVAFHLRLGATACQGLEARRARDLDAACPGSVHDRASERVLGVGLNRRGKA